MPEPTTDKKNILIQAAALLLFLLVATAVYHAIRPGLGRLTADFFYPYLRVSRVAVHAVSDRTLLSFSKVELAAKLEQLQKQNSTLALQAAASAELLRENQALRSYLGLVLPEQWSCIAAEVMLRDPLLWLEHFTINRGSLDGLAPGDAVLDVTDEGIPVLAGVIGSCGKHHAEVLTVFNPDFNFSAGIGPRLITGFVNTGNRHASDGRIPVGYMTAAETPAVGSAVVTTGFERRIPGGIKIGELDQIEDNHPLFSGTNRSTGLIRPAFNPNKLRFVLVARKDRKMELK